MTIGSIGVDHLHASLALRERLAVSGERLDALMQLLCAETLVGEAAVLSTCNRTEIYLAADEIEPALDHATRCLAGVSGVALAEVAGALERRVESAAIRHLFAVTAGLRSLAVGETQIQTQVREAFAEAARRDAAGPELGALGRAAVLCGKRVRSETALGTADTSVSALAVHLARERFGGLLGHSALLIGAGRINAVSARLLREGGISSLTIASRTYEAAARLAAEHGARAATLEELPALLAGADLAIAAARAPAALVDPATIGRRAPDRPLLLVDIAVPRNVDAAVGALPGVELVDLDGLREDAGDDGVAAAWAVVDECVERYIVEARTRRAVPLIAGLRAHVDRQKEAELARTLDDLVHLAPDDRAAVELLAHRLVNRMFHHLATRLKAAAGAPNGDAYLEALGFLFEPPQGDVSQERGSAVAAASATEPR